MESTTSVSKGVFLFPNGFKKSKHNKKGRSTLLEKLFTQEPWYMAFRQNWNVIEEKIKDLHHNTYSVILNDIVNYVKAIADNSETDTLQGVIPSATFLTGVNQPDHVSQFTTLVNKIRTDVTPHIAMINSQDASTVKHLVENTVWQLMYGDMVLDISDDEIGDGVTNVKRLKKSQCTVKALHNWYQSKYSTSLLMKKKCSKKTLVVIVPDFESFNCNVLQDFVMIISPYVPSLPTVFVFGVATSLSALHKSFPYHVSSKLLIKVFHSLPSQAYINQVLEDVFLTHTSPFHMSGKVFELLTDVFLFYDFSVTGFIQSIKYCMMDHHYGDNTKILCCERNKIETAIINLNTEDLENIRQLLSFRRFLESQDCRTKISLFEDDVFFKDVLYKEIHKLHDYLYSFYTCVRLLHAFVKDLPKNLFGKTLRETYSQCVVECVTSTEAFRECLQLLSFQSQISLVENIKSGLNVVNAVLKNVSPTKPLRMNPIRNKLNNIALKKHLGESFVKSVRVHLLLFLRQIENANTESTILTNTEMETDDLEKMPANRHRLKEKLLKATRTDTIQSEFEMKRSRFISYLENIFTAALQPPHTQPFHEILFFNDVANVKKQIVGSPRGALHTALSDPVHYIQCSCCHLSSSESVVDTLPDVCLAYKLHRECGKHINLYDWLQAFASVLRPDEDDDQPHQDAAIQTRFTRAVAELQFLGFIKSSKRKTDHVMRLTW